jgi:hypothetical protein
MVTGEAKVPRTVRSDPWWSRSCRDPGTGGVGRARLAIGLLVVTVIATVVVYLGAAVVA